MHFDFGQKNTSTPRALEPIFNTFNMLANTNMSSSFSRRLLFDDKISNNIFQISSSKEVTVTSGYQKQFMKELLSFDDDSSKHSDQETEETNSCLRSLPSEGRASCSKDNMDFDHLSRGFLSNTTTLRDRFDCSRSPSPQKKLNKEQVPINVRHEKVFSTPIKKQHKTKIKEKKSMSDFIDFKAKKRVEEISRLSTDYEVVQVIGNGSFGKVYKCVHKLDKNEYAVKETFRKFVGKHRVAGLNEIQALASLTVIEEETNVVRYYNSWVEDEKLYLVMEYCPMSLKEEMREKSLFSESQLKKILRDVCLGLSYLHRNEIVHLDIKPENILISKSRKYKLGDMGQSAIAKLSSDDVEEGDARYLAPELLNPDEYKEPLDLKKADIFSLGMTLLELATREAIPANGAEWHTLRNEKFEKLDSVEHLSNSFKNIIKLMLKRDPGQRPTIKDLLTRYLPDKIDLELRWEKIERNMLKHEKKILEEKVEVIKKRRKSIS